MTILQTIYYTCVTVYMMSVGWITHPDDYERYFMAWKLVREDPEWVKRNLLNENNENNLAPNNIEGRQQKPCQK